MDRTERKEIGDDGTIIWGLTFDETTEQFEERIIAIVNERMPIPVEEEGEQCSIL